MHMSQSTLSRQGCRLRVSFDLLQTLEFKGLEIFGKSQQYPLICDESQSLDFVFFSSLSLELLIKSFDL